MRLVIADTGPVNYLVLIEQIDLLPALFQKVILPTAVRRELDDRDTPPSVARLDRQPSGLEAVKKCLGARASRPPSILSH